MESDIIETGFELSQELKGISFIGLGFIQEKLAISFDRADDELLTYFPGGVFVQSPNIGLQFGERFVIVTRIQRRVIANRVQAVTIDRRYLSVQECAEYTGISVKTLYRWSRESKVPSHKIGHLLRFDRIEISKWIDRYKRSEINADLLG